MNNLYTTFYQRFSGSCRYIYKISQQKVIICFQCNVNFLIEIPNHDIVSRIYICRWMKIYIEFHQNIHGLIIRCQWNISNDDKTIEVGISKRFLFIKTYFLTDNKWFYFQNCRDYTRMKTLLFHVLRLYYWNEYTTELYRNIWIRHL